MKHAIRHIHFVGIGGSGMSGIAEMLLNLGYTISGSDLADSATLQRLAGLGIQTFMGHAAPTWPAPMRWSPPPRCRRQPRGAGRAREAHSGGAARADAGRADAPEAGHRHCRHARQDHHHQPGRQRAGRGRAGPDLRHRRPLNSAGANARLGSGDYIVVEADESDASFLNLLPVMAVVTNIDADHMETYGHDFNRLKAAFVDFLHRMPFYGTAILCIDDPAVREIVPQVSCPITSYGFSEDAQVRAVDVRAGGRADALHRAAAQRRHAARPAVVLNLPGEHNVLNALSAIAVAVELNVPDDAGAAALAGSRAWAGASSAMATLPAKDGGGQFTVIDDYGHHPVEMAATLAAARGAFPGRRLVLAFQPHRYTRTRDCFEDFVKVIGRPTPCCWPRSMPQAKRPIVAADGRSWRARCAWPARWSRCLSTTSGRCRRRSPTTASDGDVVMCMGAGSIGSVPGKVVRYATQKGALNDQRTLGMSQNSSNFGKVAVLMGGIRPSARFR
jgi:UDP-N-acetylmuramate--alanine ligase